jgi:riboflavin kinase/FMN adenylyltransferase
MKVIFGIGKVRERRKNTVLAIGVFDGVHRGHQALIRRAVEKARSLGGEAIVMTFMPHPVRVVHPEIDLPYIVSLPYRLKLIEGLGVDACIVVHFTKRFSRLSPQRFIQRYVKAPIQPKEIFVGDDFRFGHDRSGTIDYFREAGRRWGFTVNVVDAIKGGENKIGSSIIRRFISDGELSRAGRLLGRRVSLMARVIRGDGRGKTLGFPTANMCLRDVVIPPRGVYAVRVKIGGKMFNGMANVGCRPSFHTGRSVNVETHLFNFRGGLYQKEIVVDFIKKIRDEKIFPSREIFVTQLKKDKSKAQAILSVSLSR